MRNWRKRRQREEVRKILHTMRLELAAQRVAMEQRPQADSTLHLGDVLQRARSMV